MTEHPTLILAVHPTARGVGWALFEGPLAPMDWAVVRSTDNAKCLERIEGLLARYSPEAIVLEDFERRRRKRIERVQRLARAIVQLASNRGTEACVYSRAVVRTCFASVGARTRYEIAHAIAAHLDAFRHRMPPIRRAWMSQDARLSIFDAASLALTHFAVRGKS
jgi:Holliday junction resolvasome RuvABC endonuclease subunit